MSPISTTQQGIIAQQECAKLLMLGSDGTLEVTWELTDDERRDLEAHVHGEFGRSLVFQVKSTTYQEHRWKAHHLAIHFAVATKRLISHPLFWYFFAYLDLKAMVFADPVFLVPSAEVHAHAAPKRREATWTFNCSASLDPASKDRWRRYQVGTRDVGQRVLQLLKELRAQPGAPAAGLAEVPDPLWVTLRSEPGRRRPGEPDSKRAPAPAPRHNHG